MLVPRRLDQDGLRAYLDEVRPRFLVVRVRVERRTFTWGFPLSALEEIVGFALGAAAFAQAARSWLPERWQDAMNGASSALVQALRLVPRPHDPSPRGEPPAPVPATAAIAAPTTTAPTSGASGPVTTTVSSSRPSSATTTASSSSPSPFPSPVSALWAAANDLAGGALRDVLRVPPGEPYVSVRSGPALVDVVAY